MTQNRIQFLIKSSTQLVSFYKFEEREREKREELFVQYNLIRKNKFKGISIKITSQELRGKQNHSKLTTKKRGKSMPFFHLVLSNKLYPAAKMKYYNLHQLEENFKFQIKKMVFALTLFSLNFGCILILRDFKGVRKSSANFGRAQGTSDDVR